MKKVKIYSPATVANLVCGFDILGMALDHPQDEMELLLSDEPGIRIKHIDDNKNILLTTIKKKASSMKKE